MLFMGTSAYPDEHEYEVFLSEHGGSSNAFTDQEDTNFFFDVAPSFLPGALDRFAQFFVSPLFSSNSTSREMNAVNSEHEKNVNSDNWRMLQLMRSAANPAHPFSKFGTGDIHTLGDGAKALGYDIHKELVTFHGKHYFASNMRLVVVGREPLHELRDMVHKVFAHVPKGGGGGGSSSSSSSSSSSGGGGGGGGGLDAEPQSLITLYPGSPRLYSVAPILDAHKLSILWELPSVVPLYRCKPVSLLADLIGNDGPGSIISSLKKRNWATKHEAGIGVDGSDFALFQWKVALTQEGVHHVADILAIVYSFIADMVEDLRQGGNGGDASKPPGGMRWRWREAKDLADLRFRFREKEDAASYASSLAGNMHLYPAADVLRAESVLLEFDEQQVMCGGGS
jgi:insulysin